MSELAVLLTGTWQMLRAEFEGDTAPELVAQRTTLQLTDGNYLVRFGGETMDRGTYELGGVVSAHTLLLRGTEGTNAGRTIPCLLQLRGERLRLCFGLRGVAPTEFATAAGDGRYLATYRRT